MEKKYEYIVALSRHHPVYFLRDKAPKMPY
jgi:hypothetical protein